MHNFHYFLCLLVLLTSVSLRAQVVPAGEVSYIELSPAELESLVRKLARHRSRIGVNQTDALSLQPAGTSSLATADDKQLREQLRRMENLLVQLTERMAIGQDQARLRDAPSPGIEDETGNEALIRELRRQSRDLEEMEARLLARNPEAGVADQAAVSALRAELDSLRMAFLRVQVTAATTAAPKRDTVVQLVPAPVTRPPATDEGLVDSLFREIAALRGAMRRERDTVVLRPSIPPPPVLPAEKKTQDWPSIYFENGSDVIAEADRSIILAVVQTYRQSRDTDIIIVGYTSPKGSPIFNKSLAARRAERVSEALQQAGIPPAAITTTYGGIDYRADNAAAARRVEIQTRNRP